MSISNNENKENADYSEYLQSLRKYRDEIKQEVTANTNTLKSEIKEYRGSKFIIGTPVIGQKSDLFCPEQNRTENVIKIYIYNVNGNSNEVKLVPGEVSVREGTLEDLNLNEENIQKITSIMDELRKKDWGQGVELKIPIYIFNINNILSNGNKNEVTVK